MYSDCSEKPNLMHNVYLKKSIVKDNTFCVIFKSAGILFRFLLLGILITHSVSERVLGVLLAKVHI